MEDSLESVLHHAILALLDSKPDDPIGFLAVHFQRECEKSNRVAQAAHLLEGMSIYHPAIDDRLYKAYNTISQYKVQQEVQGLTGDIYTDLLVQLASGVPESKLEKLLLKIQCQSTEYVSFPVFKSGVLTCLHLKEFINEVKKLYQDMADPEINKTSKVLCDLALTQLSTALNASASDPIMTIDMGIRMNVQHLNCVLGSQASKLDGDMEPSMQLGDFLSEALTIFLQQVPQVK